MSAQVRLKVHGHGGGLCRSCDHAQVTERATGEEMYWCLWIHPPMRMYPDVVRCSAYNNKAQPTQHAMEEIAWVVRHDTAGVAVGFAPPPPKKKDD